MVLLKKDRPVARHFWDSHEGKPNGRIFWVVQDVKFGQRKGDLDRMLPRSGGSLDWDLGSLQALMKVPHFYYLHMNAFIMLSVV